MPLNKASVRTLGRAVWTPVHWVVDKPRLVPSHSSIDTVFQPVLVYVENIIAVGVKGYHSEKMECQYLKKWLRKLGEPTFVEMQFGGI